jgi:hypothetical protein
MLSILNYKGHADQNYIKFHLIPHRMAIMRKQQSGENVGKRNPHILLVGM